MQALMFGKTQNVEKKRTKCTLLINVMYVN